MSLFVNRDVMFAVSTLSLSSQNSQTFSLLGRKERENRLSLPFLIFSSLVSLNLGENDRRVFHFSVSKSFCSLHYIFVLCILFFEQIFSIGDEQDQFFEFTKQLFGNNIPPFLITFIKIEFDSKELNPFYCVVD